MEDKESIIVRYEDLIVRPIEETSRIFESIGTNFPEGTDTYFAPANYNWGWRKNDGTGLSSSLRQDLQEYRGKR